MAYKPIESHEEYLKILENYKDYKRNTYQSMSLDEKINFFDGIHTDNVPMFDENGKEYGLHHMLHYLIADDVAYPFLKEAMEILVSSAGSSADFSADSSAQELVRQIINDEITGLPSFAKYSEGTELERIEELKRIVSGWQEN